MKKLFILLVIAISFIRCGVGLYSHSSGRADQGEISFTATDKYKLEVSVDNKTYMVQSVKQKDWKKNRNIKKTALNTINVSTGQHSIVISRNGNVIFTKKIFVSAGEHKIIEL